MPGNVIMHTGKGPYGEMSVPQLGTSSSTEQLLTFFQCSSHSSKFVTHMIVFVKGPSTH